MAGAEPRLGRAAKARAHQGARRQRPEGGQPGAAVVRRILREPQGASSSRHSEGCAPPLPATADPHLVYPALPRPRCTPRATASRRRRCSQSSRPSERSAAWGRCARLPARCWAVWHTLSPMLQAAPCRHLSCARRCAVCSRAFDGFYIRFVCKHSFRAHRERDRAASVI